MIYGLKYSMGALKRKQCKSPLTLTGGWGFFIEGITTPFTE
jgi:hypothetical protein